MKKIIRGFGEWEYYEKVNVLYWWKTYMERHVWTHWLYMIIPFVFTTIIFMLMEHDGVLIMEGEKAFSFFKRFLEQFLHDNVICTVILFVADLSGVG